MNAFQDGVRLFKEGRYLEAVKKLHSVTSAEHTNHKAWNALGVSLSKIGDIDQSITCFENALALDSTNQTYAKNLERAKAKRTGRGQVPAFTKRQTDRTAELPSVVSTDIPQDIISTEHAGYSESVHVPLTPDKKDLATDSLNRALSLFGQASYHGIPDLMQEALSYVERALDIDPDYFDALQLKVSILVYTGRENPDHLTEALKACDRALSLRPDQASMWFNKAGVLESLRRYEDAIAAYDRSYAYSSDEPMRLGVILMKKAAALESAGRDSQALKVYEQVPVTDRFFGDAMEKKAEYLEQIGNRESAVASYRTAGLTHLKQNQFEKAIYTFNHLLSLVPGDEESAYNKGTALLALYDQKQSRDLLEEALICFDTALKAHPENMTYLIQKGRCLLDLGRFEEGLQFLDRALWINPSDGITLMNKGIALYQLSRHEEALKYFDLVSSHYPEHADSWMMKSRIHLDWKQYDTALLEIDQAIQRSEHNTRALEQRAVILRALGREDEARETEMRNKRIIDPIQ